MSDNDDWRRERAAQLHGGNDWTIRPASAPMTSAPATDVLPMRLTPTAGSSAAGGSRTAPPIAPRAAAAPPPAEPTRRKLGARLGPFVVAALGLIAAVVGWLVFGRTAREGTDAAAPMIAAASPASPSRVAAAAPASALTAPAPVVSRCADPLAATALSAAIRSGTAFDGDTPRNAALDSVVQTGSDGGVAVCHAILNLELADARAGSPTATQIVSGPIDYVVDPGPVAGAPVFRVLRAPSIVRRLAMMPAPAPPVLAAAPPPAAASVAAVPGRVLSAPVAGVSPRPPVEAPIENATAAPAAAMPEPVPERSDNSPPPQAAVPAVDPAADSDVARALYGTIRRSGDVEALAAADEGRDLYLRRSSRCRRPACAAGAYRTWVAQLRYIVDHGRDAGN